MSESSLNPSSAVQPLQAVFRQLAIHGFSVLLVLTWAVAVALALPSNSLFLAVPFGGFFPLLYLILNAYLPHSPMNGNVAVCAVMVISICLVYATGGHSAGLLPIPAGFVIACLYLSVWPLVLGELLIGSLYYTIKQLSFDQTDRLWRLELKFLTPFADPILMLTLAGICMAGLGLVFYGRWLISRRVARWPIFQSQSTVHEQELTTRLKEGETQILELTERVAEHERLNLQLKGQLTELKHQLEKQRAEANRVRDLANIQQQEHQRKLVQALSEGILLRALMQASGVLLFRLNRSGEILSTNPAAGELVRIHQLKQISDWVLTEQPQLAQPIGSWNNWKALGSFLSTIPSLLRIRKNSNQVAWVWATARAVDSLNQESSEEWILLALELDARLQALAAAQNLEVQHEREQLSLAQQEHALQKVQVEAQQLKTQLELEINKRKSILSGLPMGVGVLRSVLPLEIVEANTLFLNLTLRPDQSVGSNQWIEPIELQLKREVNRLKADSNLNLSLSLSQANGNQTNLRLLARPLASSETTSGWLVVIQDWTRIQQAEQLFEQVAESSPIPFLIAGMSSRKLIYGNPSLCQVLSYTPEELVELVPDDLFADKRQRAELIVALKRMSQVEAYPVQLRTRSGRVLDALCTLRVTQLLGERCILGSFVPVAHFHQDFKEEKGSLRAIGGWTLDLGSLALELDDVFASETGLNKTHWKLHEFMSRCLSSEDSRLLNELLSRMVKSQQVQFQDELIYELRTPEGSLRLAGSFAALADSAGSLVACRAEHRVQFQA